MKLTWLKPDPGDEFIRTKCNRYTIARYRGPPLPEVYLLWKRRAFKANGEWQPDIVGKFDSARAAMLAANDLQVEQ